VSLNFNGTKYSHRLALRRFKFWKSLLPPRRWLTGYIIVRRNRDALVTQIGQESFKIFNHYKEQASTYHEIPSKEFYNNTKPHTHAFHVISSKKESESRCDHCYVHHAVLRVKYRIKDIMAIDILSDIHYDIAVPTIVVKAKDFDNTIRLLRSV